MSDLQLYRQRFWGNNGELLAGGKVYTYAAGTSTPQTSYSDYALTIPNTNPVILDSKGEASIYTAGRIKVNVTDANGVQITGFPVDNLCSGFALDIHNATSKTTPIDADELGIWDSVSSSLKKLTWANLKATAKTYFDTLYAALTGANMTGGINWKYSTVASDATTADLFATTVGNLINYTGTTTATAFVAAPQAGCHRALRCASSVGFTAGANMLIDGYPSGSTFVAYAGQWVDVYAITTTQFRLVPRPWSAQWNTPTLYNTTNVAASTTNYGLFTVANGMVTFSLRVSIDPTAAAATVLGIAIGEGANSPPASNFANAVNACGVGAEGVTGQSAGISLDAANDRLNLNFTATDVANRVWCITGQYRII